MTDKQQHLPTQIAELFAEEEITEYELVLGFDLTKIDRDASLSNQARVLAGAIDDDHVYQVGAAIKAGRTFPPLIVYALPSGKYLILDGNHRFVAVVDRLGRTKFDAVVITQKLTETDIWRVSKRANLWNGKEISADERRTQALFMLRQREFDVPTVAKMFDVSEDSLRRALKTEEVKERLDAKGRRRAARELSAGALQRLGAIRDDDVLAVAADYALEAKRTGKDLSEFVTGLRKIATTRQQLDRIRELRLKAADDKQRSKRRGSSPKPLSVAFSSLGRVSNIDLDELFGSKVDPEDFLRLKKEARAAQRAAKVIADMAHARAA